MKKKPTILKKRILLIAFLLIAVSLSAITIKDSQKFNHQNEAWLSVSDSDKYAALNKAFGYNKILPKGYEKQALEALSHYPELKDVKIEFRLVEKLSPFTSRPTVGSTLVRNAKKRTYLILISTKTIDLLQSILINKMQFAAQVGVLGHELAHVSDFIHRNFFQMIRVSFGNLSNNYLKGFESATDMRTIQHGMGCELLAWSTYIRGEMKLRVKTDNKDENGNEDIMSQRYMTPDQIKQAIKDLGSIPCENL